MDMFDDMLTLLICLVDGKFADAIEQYTEAIFCDIPDAKKSVYLCNRSLASLKLEEN